MAINRRTFIKTTSLAGLGSLLYSCTGKAGIRIPKGARIGCFGDSITATEPKGYVSNLQSYYDEYHTDHQLEFLNWGKSSETITGLTETDHPGPRPYLFERLDSVLDSQEVQVVFFCYGINCGIYGPPSTNLFESFEIGAYSFLEKLKQRDIPAVFLTTPPLATGAIPLKKHPEGAPYSYRFPYPDYEKEVLVEFRKILMGISHSQLLGTIDIHSKLWQGQHSFYDKDPIHPNAAGHQEIARSIQREIIF